MPIRWPQSAPVCGSIDLGPRVDLAGRGRGARITDEDEFDEWVALAANGPACVPSGSKRAEWLKARQD